MIQSNSVFQSPTAPFWHLNKTLNPAREIPIISVNRRLSMKMQKAGFFLLFLCFTTLASAKAEVVVSGIEGSASIIRNGQTIAVEKGMKIQRNDTVKTESNGRLDIVLNNAAGLRVQPSSEIRLKQIKPKKIDIELVVGNIFANVKKLLKGSSFEVETGTAVMGVRGTKLSASHKNGKTTFAASEGQLKVKDKATGNTYDVSAGNAIDIGEGTTSEVRGTTTEESNDLNQTNELATESSSSGSENSPGNGKPVEGETTQGEFALWLVKQIGALDKLPPAALGQDAINFLFNLGIAPKDGKWDANAPITKEFLISLLDLSDEEANQLLSSPDGFSELLDKVVFVAETAFANSEAGASEAMIPPQNPTP